MKTVKQQLRALYDWMMLWAQHPKGGCVLGALAFAEAVVFPLPIDPLLAALSLARPRQALRFALLSTVMSVLGGLLGYALGFWFWTSVSEFILPFISSAQLDDTISKFQQNAFGTIFLAGLSPIPFKVLTVAAGMAHLNIGAFITGAFLGRALRFFTIAYLLYKFGAPIKVFIDKHFYTVAMSSLLLLALFVSFIVF